MDFGMRIAEVRKEMGMGDVGCGMRDEKKKIEFLTHITDRTSQIPDPTSEFKFSS